MSNSENLISIECDGVQKYKDNELEILQVPIFYDEGGTVQTINCPYLHKKGVCLNNSEDTNDAVRFPCKYLEAKSVANMYNVYKLKISQL